MEPSTQERRANAMRASHENQQRILDFIKAEIERRGLNSVVETVKKFFD